MKAMHHEKMVDAILEDEMAGQPVGILSKNQI